MTLKQQILDLNSKGLNQKEISIELSCSSSTVSYHLNPDSISRIKENRRKRKLNKVKPIKDLSKEISVENKTVDWKHSEAVCLAKLVEFGYEVFLPFSGGGEIDMIAFKDSKCYKIQIKSTSPKDYDHICIHLNRNSLNYKKSVSKKYENIDFYLIYDGTNIYKIDHSDDSEHVSLRYKVPSNCQLSKIKMASDYIFTNQ